MSFQEEHKKVMKVLVKYFRRFYSITFNLYAWYWIYKLIFIKENTTWEDYVIWFFTVTGMYFFVLDGKDKYLKKFNGVENLEE